jgi:hypothetical protein
MRALTLRVKRKSQQTQNKMLRKHPTLGKSQYIVHLGQLCYIKRHSVSYAGHTVRAKIVKFAKIWRTGDVDMINYASNAYKTLVGKPLEKSITRWEVSSTDFKGLGSPLMSSRKVLVFKRVQFPSFLAILCRLANYLPNPPVTSWLESSNGAKIHVDITLILFHSFRVYTKKKPQTRVLRFSNIRTAGWFKKWRQTTCTTRQALVHEVWYAG